MGKSNKCQKLKRLNSHLNTRGITLVALVITIVVLIILATITINLTFRDNGIINKAEEAKSVFANGIASDEERLTQIMEEYNNAMYEPEVVSWTYDKATQTVTDGTTTLKIGDYVNYNHKTGATVASYKSLETTNGYGDQTFTVADYNYGWRVLGADEDGQLLLIAEDFVPLTGGTEDKTAGRTYYWLGDPDEDLSVAQSAYVNAEEELKNICEIYGQGEGATGGRSVTVDDINKITGYDPNKTGDGNPYESGKVYEYGNDVTYTLTSSKVNYIGTKYPTKSTSSSYSTFTYYTGREWKTLAEGESATLKSTYYLYYPNTLTTNSTADTEPGITTESTAYKMLFTNSSTGAYSSGSGSTSYFYYWLGSSYVYAGSGYARFGVHIVDDGSVYGHRLYVSNGDYNLDYYGVRPVVSIKSTVSLTDSGTTKDGCTLWNMK